MTTIKIFRDQNKDCIGYEISGHAGYDDSGRDIVCAAISVLATTTHNSIEKLTSDQFGHEEDEESGYMYLMLQDNPSKEAKLLLNSMVLGLIELEEQFSSSKKKFLKKRYLKLIFKEV